MDVQDLRWVLAVARTRSISKTAKTHGVAVSTVTRRLDAIEARLGLTLMDRRSDGARLTADGARIAAIAADFIDQADRLLREADMLRTPQRKTVVVTATEFVISEILAPDLAGLAAIDPALIVDLRSQAAVVSLAGREADIAIRMSPPEGASLLSRALPPIALGTFASPGYLAGRDPARLDLSRERLLTYNESYGRVPELEVLRAAGLENACVAVTNSTRALLAAAVAGAGVALLPTVFARRAGLLQVRSPTFPARRPYLVTHRDLRRRRDIDAVHRWIRGSFGMALRGAE